MKVKESAFFLFIMVIVITQQANGDSFNHKVFSQLNNKLHLQSVKEKFIKALFREATAQGKAKGPNPKCPDLSTTKKLYRVIRSDESCQTGLIAKNSNAGSTVLYHVRYGSKNIGTQFISTTTSLDIANTKYWPNVQPGGALVEIDINNLPGNCDIVNLNDGTTRERELGSNVFAFNFARHDCEVLLDCGNSRVHCKVLNYKSAPKTKAKGNKGRMGVTKTITKKRNNVKHKKKGGKRG